MDNDTGLLGNMSRMLGLKRAQVGQPVTAWKPGLHNRMGGLTGNAGQALASQDYRQHVMEAQAAGYTPMTPEEWMREQSTGGGLLSPQPPAGGQWGTR